MAELCVLNVIIKLPTKKGCGNMRRKFAEKLLREAKNNHKIWLVTADLGYGLWNEFEEQLPERFLNTGASEQAASDICVGLALEGHIPFFYSITTFLLYRSFETLRTYINHEKLNVKLVASGRDKDYEIDGISHWSEDAKYFLDGLPNIHQIWPETEEDIPDIVENILACKSPDFVSLHR